MSLPFTFTTDPHAGHGLCPDGLCPDKNIHWMRSCPMARRDGQAFGGNNSASGMQRRALTVIELIVALALLSVAMLTASKMLAQLIQNGKALSSNDQALQMLVNFRELIGTWPVDRITPENIQQLSSPKNAVASENPYRLDANIVECQEPIVGKQVTLQISWQSSVGEPRQSTLAFWVPKS